MSLGDAPELPKRKLDIWLLLKALFLQSALEAQDECLRVLRGMRCGCSEECLKDAEEELKRRWGR